MSKDLTAFLNARLAEDERIALDWQSARLILTQQYQNDPRRQHVRPRREPVTDAQLAKYRYGDRFNPDRALRDIRARRQTLVRCQEEMLSGIPRLVHFAKQTLWEMAQRDADHKDFLEEWRP